MRFVIAFLLIISLLPAAYAQVPRQNPSDADRAAALTGKLQDELSTEMELRTIIVQAQRQMAELQKANADLKAKCGKPCEDEKK